MQVVNNQLNRSNYQVNNRTIQQNTSNPAFGMKIFVKELNNSPFLKQIRTVALKDQYRFDIDGDSGKKIVKEWGPSTIIPGGSVYDKVKDLINKLRKQDDNKELFVLVGKKEPFIAKKEIIKVKGEDKAVDVSNRNIVTMVLREGKSEVSTQLLDPKITEFDKTFETELLKLEKNLVSRTRKSNKYFDNIAPRVAVLVEGGDEFAKKSSKSLKDSLTNFLKKLELKEQEELFITITPEKTIIELAENYLNYKSVKKIGYIDNIPDAKIYNKNFATEIKQCRSVNQQLITTKLNEIELEGFLKESNPFASQA
jgi:dihydroxyacetone kinase-like predicted kinase